jgi:hypothetical protein
VETKYLAFPMSRKQPPLVYRPRLLQISGMVRKELDMLSIKHRLIQAVLVFLHGALIAVKRVNYACVRIPVRRVSRQ